MKFKDITISVSMILICLGVGALVFSQYSLQDGGQSFGGLSTVASRGCSVSTSTLKYVGNSTSNGSAIVLEANSLRAYARISLPDNATNTVFLSFDEGAGAVSGKGILLNGFSGITNGGTTTQQFIEFGRNTDFPYVGAVTGVTLNTVAGSTTTLAVTECVY